MESLIAQLPGGRSSFGSTDVDLHVAALRYLSSESAWLRKIEVHASELAGELRERFARLSFGGPTAAKDLQLLYIFDSIVLEFKRGAASSNDIGKRFADLDMSGTLAPGLPSSPSRVSVRCKEIRLYFGRALGLPGRAPEARLFEVKGAGWNTSGLTPLGDLAWRWAKERLKEARIIAQTR